MGEYLSVAVGDVLRDRQYDGGTRTGRDMTKRTIRVLEVDDDYVVAKAITGYDGRPMLRAPRRRISRSGSIGSRERPSTTTNATRNRFDMFSPRGPRDTPVGSDRRARLRRRRAPHR